MVDLIVHPRDNDLVIATHARGFYVLDDVTPLQEMASWAGRLPSTQLGPGKPASTESATVGAGFSRPGPPTLFKPMPAVRYTPASDTSVLGNRVWVARNQPYGAILNYYLPAASSTVQLSIKDASGREVQRVGGPGEAGLNRAVWNLSERSSCADGSEPTEGRGRGRGGARGGGGTWLRAVPGTYTVQLTAGGASAQQSFQVRMDPRIQVTDQDMQAWYREASMIERTECTLSRAAAMLAELERRAAELEAGGKGEAAGAMRGELGAVTLILRGDPRDPGHVNLPGRINWLTIQVGNYSGRPTKAQSEWIHKYAAEADAVVTRLNALRAKIAGRVPPGIMPR